MHKGALARILVILCTWQLSQNVVGQASQPEGAPSDVALIRAQLQVLELLHSGSGDTQERDMIERRIGEYVAQGYPRAGFTRDALREAALKWTGTRVMYGGGAIRVAIARAKYGIDPEDVYRFMPPRGSDAIQDFEAYRRSRAPEVLHRFQADPLRPGDVRNLIAYVQESGPEASNTLVSVLAGDWSRDGQAFLYRRLREAKEPSQQIAVIRALAQRAQIDADPLSDVANTTSNDELLRAIFDLAELTLNSDSEAVRFVLGQMGSARERNRDLAVAALSKHGRGKEETIINAIRQESDPGRRVHLLRLLSSTAGQPIMLKFLRELAARDSSPSVRAAAIDAIPEYVICLEPQVPVPAYVSTPDQISAEDLRLIARAAKNKEVSDAVERKLSRVAEKRNELDRQRARYRGALKSLESKPAGAGA